MGQKPNIIFNVGCDFMYLDLLQFIAIPNPPQGVDVYMHDFINNQYLNFTLNVVGYLLNMKSEWLNWYSG